ncbi:MAG: pyruvate carboxylase [Clostridiaceae bacterium]
MKKVLIANRGEIAVRAARACYELGLETVAIYSKEDEGSLHRFKTDQSYLVGAGKKPAEAYLDIEGIIAIAKSSGCDAVYPGYGFLAENGHFAERCAQEGLTFVGPKPEHLHMLGDKIQAKQAAITAGLQTIPGTEKPLQNVQEVIDFANQYDYPVLIKASMGGGGRGMRVVRNESEVRDAFATAVSEALTAFGCGDVYVEKFLENPKHIEVQILADTHGHVLHLFERDCSVQRRHQKVVEFAPCIALSEAQRQSLCMSTVAFMESIGYQNAGTVEYLYTGGQFYFIEVNPRIQVEHTVTELITGIDIVVSQLKIAAGLDFYNDMNMPHQDELKITNVAIQCRVTTENPENNFLPDTGKINTYRSPGGPGIRLDSANGYAGAVILPYYDSLLSKLCSFAPTFEEACIKMERALREYRIRGVMTNIPFLLNLVRNDEFRTGNATTTLIDENPDLRSFTHALNRGNKVLQYVGDITVNGFPGIGKSEKEILPEATLPKKFNLETEKFDIPKLILDTQGPDAVSKWILDQKKVLVSDLTFRDAHQSLIATRMRTTDMAKIATLTEEALPHIFSYECWGGATFDTAMRFLTEDPWERLRILRQKMPNSLLQMLFRGSNAVGYTSYPDNVIREFIRLAANNGIDLFRVFDSLNWLPQIEQSIRAVRDNNKIAEAAICYTGDIMDPLRQKYSLKYFVDLAKEMEALGANIIAIKDMSGVLKPEASYVLVSELKEKLSIPVHLHSHNTTGNGISTLVEAVRAGVDIVDTAFAPFSDGTSHPNLSTLYYALNNHERRPDVDIQNVEKINYYWEGVRPFYKSFDVGISFPQTEAYYHEMPGGQFTNLREQAKGLGMEDKWDDIKTMYHDVNLLFGDIVKVTPSSKVVGDMALFMVQNGIDIDEFYIKGPKIDFPESVIDFYQGNLGQPTGSFVPSVRDVILKGRPFSTERPGSKKPPIDFLAVKATVRAFLPWEPTEEDVMSYIMYPKVYEEYIKKHTHYGKTSSFDTLTFFHGMRQGEAVSVEIEEGKILFIRLLQLGDVDSQGRRVLYFELNGQPREIIVQDHSSGKKATTNRKSEPSNRLHIGSTMPGSIVRLAIKVGDIVHKGDVLLVTESMKMETTISAPFDAQIHEILVNQGDMVETHDLLVVLEDEQDEDDRVLERRV